MFVACIGLNTSHRATQVVTRALVIVLDSGATRKRTGIKSDFHTYRRIGCVTRSNARNALHFDIVVRSFLNNNIPRLVCILRIGERSTCFVQVPVSSLAETFSSGVAIFKVVNNCGRARFRRIRRTATRIATTTSIAGAVHIVNVEIIGRSFALDFPCKLYHIRHLQSNRSTPASILFKCRDANTSRGPA